MATHTCPSHPCPICYPQVVALHAHRVVHLPVKTLDDLAREHRDAHPDLIEQLRAHRPSTLERIEAALDSERGFWLFVGFFAGVIFCCASMIAFTVLA